MYAPLNFMNTYSCWSTTSYSSFLAESRLKSTDLHLIGANMKENIFDKLSLCLLDTIIGVLDERIIFVKVVEDVQK